MENNPTLPLPVDYQRFPGKMDHTSVVVVRVGDYFSLKKSAKERFLNDTNLRRSFNLNNSN